MDDTTKPASSLGVPVAIVIAGGLIALSIYYGGGVSRTAVAVPSPAAPQPQEPAIGDIRPVSAEDYVRGPANAKVTIIEYSDLECPFCKQFHPTMQKIVQDYPNDVRWVYRHFPLEQLHQQAPKESEAVECADEQGKGWEMIDTIYEVTTSNDGLDLATLPTLARQVGVVNIPQFEACVESGKYASRVADDIADAQSAGGRGTPSSVILGPNGDKVPINGAQPYASVKAAVERLL
jgi:protein-disulfide isomerase